MGNTWITDITHFEGIPPDLAQGPAGRIARYFGAIVSAASVSPMREVVGVALWCRRRPARHPCPGHLLLYRHQPSGPIEWRCSVCDDRGLISNWRGSTWDQSAGQQVSGESLEMVVSREELEELRKVMAFDLPSQRIVDGARFTAKGIVLLGSEASFRGLLERLAADANPGEGARRRRLLNAVYERTRALLDRQLGKRAGAIEPKKGGGLEPPRAAEAFLASLERRGEFVARRGGQRVVAAETVERTWKWMAGLSRREARKLAHRMQREQPGIQAYLLAVDQDILNQHERELLLYMGTVVWQAMARGTGRFLPRVMIRTIEEAEARNLQMLERLEGKSEAAFENTAREMAASCGQSELLKYVIETLMEKPEKGCVIRDRSRGVMMLDLKSVLDAFDS